MKKSFSRWIQLLTTATNSESSAEKKKTPKGRKSSAPRSKKLAVESLEERCMLTASAITFDQLADFTYKSDSASAITFALERSHFLEVAKIGNVGNDIVSIDRELQTVSVFLNNGSSSNQYGAAVKTVISDIGGSNSNVKSRQYAVADMNADGVADLLVFSTTTVIYSEVVDGKTVHKTRGDLNIDVYQGSSNGTFATSYTRSTITYPFSLSANDNDLELESLQVREVVADSSGKVHPDLLITMTGTAYEGSSKTKTTKSFFFVGQDKGFQTTAIAVPSTVTGNAIGFGKVTSDTSALQLISQTTTTPTDDKKVIQTLNFYNATATTTTLTATAAGKKEYTAANPIWTKIANVNRDAPEEIITGINYINANSQNKYAVRISHVSSSSLPSGTSDVQITPSTIDTDIEPRYCTIGDMNNDGYIDILVSDGTSYQFLVGSSTGQFTLQSKIDSFANYLATQVGDFDGDGYQDVIAIGEKQLMFLPGNPSDPNYNTGKVLLDFSADVTNAVFGDFDGDGYMDFVVAQGKSGTTLTLYTGLAPGKSNLFSKFTTITEAINPSVLVAGNFINKRVPGALHPKDDLAVLHDDGKEILTFSFDGATVTPKTTRLPAAVTPVTHMAKGDFNNDLYDDIITVNETKATVSIFKNKGDGSFDLNATTVTVGTVLDVNTQIGSKPSVVATADINGDGRLDFAVLNAGDNQIRFYTQNANGEFNHDEKTDRISNLALKAGVRNYQMMFEDFDSDGRIDIIVGVSSATNQAMVFQNKGSQAGKYDTTVNWVGAGTLTLEGSLNSKTVFGMATGFKTGSKSAAGYGAKTPGVVIVSGNKIFRFENTTVSEVSSGSMEIVFREYDPDYTVPLYNAQYDTIPAGSDTDHDPRLTWLHEWGHYYLEVWGSIGSTTDTNGITSFTTTVNYDKTLFKATTSDIQTSSNFTLDTTTTKVDVNSGKIIVSGTSKSTGIGKDKYVLLFRVFVSPADNTSTGSKENVGVPIPEFGYAKPVSSGFLYDSGTSQMNSKNLVNLADGKMMPVYPVIYDFNDDGIINVTDFTALTNPSNWGQKVEGEDSVYAKWDFDHLDSRKEFEDDYYGQVGIGDFTNFTRAGTFSALAASQVKRGDIFLHFRFPGRFPAYWPQLASADVPEPSADLMEVSKPVVAIENIDDIVQNEETAALIDDFLASIEDETPENVVTEEVSEFVAIAEVAEENADVFVNSSNLDFATASRFEFAPTALLTVSELDTLGYVARTESVFDATGKRVEAFDQALSQLFDDADGELTTEEFFEATVSPLDSLRLTDKVLVDLLS